MSYKYDGSRAAYDFDRDAVGFYAEAEGNRIPSRVSSEALHDYFQVTHINGTGLVSIFQENAELIGEVAARKFKAGQVEPDGSILVRYQDLV